MTSTITVITPTTGAATLPEAIRSVAAQKVEGYRVRHLLVCDGEQHERALMDLLLDITREPVPNLMTRVITLPDNTHKGEWYGHRIYANVSQLVESEFIAFLDEDNYYEPNHLASLVPLALRMGFAWSRRKVVKQDGTLIGEDRDEAIGTRNAWGRCLVDTSCWMFHRHTIRHARHIEGKWGADAQLTEHVIEAFGVNFIRAGSGLPTLVYRAPERLYAFFGGFCK